MLIRQLRPHQGQRGLLTAIWKRSQRAPPRPTTCTTFRTLSATSKTLPEKIAASASSGSQRADKERDVKELCSSLHRLHPLRYAFLAGKADPEDTEEDPGSSPPLLLDKGDDREGFRKGFFDAAAAKSGHVIPAKTAPATPSEDRRDTTAKFIERVLRGSTEEQVRTRVGELLQLVKALDARGATGSDDGSGDQLGRGVQLEERCLELYDSWVGNTKFGVAFLFYLGRALEDPSGGSVVAAKARNLGGPGDGFVTKVVVEHLSTKLDDMSPEEAVTLMLMLYFREAPWTPEELFEVLDPTLLQKRLALLAPHLTNAEMCAVVLGLRRAAKITINISDFRDQLYQWLTRLGLNFASGKVKKPDFATANRAISQVCSLLQQGTQFSRDPVAHIAEVLRSFEGAVSRFEADDNQFPVDIRSSLKVMTFGSSRGGLHNPDLTRLVLERLTVSKGGELALLSIRDLADLAKFLGLLKDKAAHFAEESWANEFGKMAKDLGPLILGEVSSTVDNGCNLLDAKDLMKVLLYLCSLGEPDVQRIKSLFDDLNSVPLEEFSPSSMELPREARVADVGLRLGKACFRSLLPRSFKQAAEGVGGGDMEAAAPGMTKYDLMRFPKLALTLDRTLKIYSESEDGERWQELQGVGLEDQRLQALAGLTQRSLPPALFDLSQSSALVVKDFSKKHRLMRGVFQGLATVLGNEDYVGILHLLPHFPDPDLVIGHIAGNLLFIPHSLRALPAFAVKPAPEIGEWIVISVADPVAKTDHGDVEKHRQLLKLGYHVYRLSADDQKLLLKFHDKRWAHRILANVMTGNIQPDPSSKTTPVF